MSLGSTSSLAIVIKSTAVVAASFLLEKPVVSVMSLLVPALVKVIVLDIPPKPADISEFKVTVAVVAIYIFFKSYYYADVKVLPSWK